MGLELYSSERERERERERVRGMAGNDDEMDRLDLEDETDRLQLVTGSS